MKKYHVVRFIKRNKEISSALISEETVADDFEDRHLSAEEKEMVKGFSYYLPPGATEIKDMGIVTIISEDPRGAEEHLRDIYEEQGVLPCLKSAPSTPTR